MRAGLKEMTISRFAAHWLALLMGCAVMATSSSAALGAFAEDGNVIVEPLDPQWCSEPAKMLVRAKTGEPIDPSTARFRRLVETATASAIALCRNARTIDLWLKWGDHIALIGRARAETGWAWPPFRVPDALAASRRRTSPTTPTVVPRRTVPPAALPAVDPPTTGRSPWLFVGWLISVVTCVILYAVGPPPAKRFAYATLNVLLAFVPILFGMRPPPSA